MGLLRRPLLWSRADAWMSLHGSRVIRLHYPEGLLEVARVLTPERRERVRELTVRETPPLSWEQMIGGVTVTLLSHATSGSGYEMPSSNIMRLNRGVGRK